MAGETGKESLIDKRILWDEPEVQELLTRHEIPEDIARRLLALVFHKHYDGESVGLQEDLSALLREAVARQAEDSMEIEDDETPEIDDEEELA